MVVVDSTHEIRTKLLGYLVAKHARDNPGVDLEHDSLVNEGVLDSLSFMKLVEFIEHELGAKIPDEDLLPEDFDTLDKITAVVAARRRR